MSVEIAQGSVLLLLDRTQFDADMAALQSEVAALSGGASGGGGSGGSGGGAFNSWVNWKSGNSAALNNINRAGYDFANSSQGRAAIGRFPGGGRINQAIDLGNRTGGTREFFLGEDTATARNAAKETGGALGIGMAEGIRGKAEEIATEGRNAVKGAITAAREEAEIASPSRRGARDIGVPIAAGIAQGVFSGQQQIIDSMGGGAYGVPIMQQVQAAQQFSTANMLGNMVNAARFSFWNWGMSMLGGLPGFGGMGGLNVVNDGGMNVFGQGFGNILANQWDAGQTQAAGIGFPGFLGGLDRFGVSSRSLLGQLPTGIKDFGANLVEGLLDSILPGFAAGPAGDMITTLLGLRPIITRDAALADGTFSATGTGFGSDSAFSDSPFFGQGFTMTNNFEGTGSDSVNQMVSQSILATMRRLGIS